MIHTQIVSSDMLRRVITLNPAYAENERGIGYAAIISIAKLLKENGETSQSMQNETESDAERTQGKRCQDVWRHTLNARWSRV